MSQQPAPDPINPEPYPPNQSATAGDSSVPFMQLVLAAQNGDPTALGQLIEQCRDYLLLIANEDISPELHGKFGASDFVQETMMIAHQKFPQFRGQTPAELKGWLRQILRNDLLRARRRFVTAQSRDVWREQRLDDSQRPNLSIKDANDTPSTAALAAEEARILKEAMARLPENYRRAIWLREWEDRSYPEIGAQLGISEEAARKLCRRALDKLEDFLKPFWSTSEPDGILEDIDDESSTS